MTTYCEEYAALLDLFVDGELPPEELERVRAHLEACPGCRAYVDDALAIRAGFPDVEDTVVPENFAEGVMERVRAEVRKSGRVVEWKKRSFRRWTGTLAALAACCALVIVLRTGDGVPAMKDKSLYSAGDAPADCAAEESVITGAAVQEAGARETETAPAAATKGAETDGMEAAEEKLDERAVRSTAVETESGSALAAAPAPAAAPAEDAASAVMNREASLYLSAGEAGDLLDGFDPVWENAVEWRYELNREEYRALLEALGRPEELPEAAEGPFLVSVTGPKE